MTSGALGFIESIFPQAVAAASVLHPSLTNMNAVLHVPGMVASLGRIESVCDFDFYGEGVTPSVARLVDDCDAERLRLAQALGASVPKLQGWVSTTAYGVRRRTP